MPIPEELAKVLTLHFAEVEDVKKEGNDSVLDIDVRPNRAGDCLSHIGIAREISAILNYKLKIPDSKFIEDKKLKARDFVSVRFEGKGPCARYTARVVSGLEVGPSPEWIQERLRVCGLRPINNVVDIANYVMLETGQPLHAFDNEKIEGRGIVVRFAKNGERIVTLDENKYDLDDEILVIADSKKPMAIAGIKGGKIPEVDKNTKTIVIESANFNSQVIRRASGKINLKTDASLRFEHGIDPNMAESAINRAAYLIKKIAGGRVTGGLIDIYPKKIFPKFIKLDLAYAKSLLGVEIPTEKIKTILENLDFEIRNRKLKNPKFLDIKVPTRRIDVSIPEDLIEEIGRIYGYGKITAVFPRTSLIPPKRNLDIFWEDAVKNILKEIGFTEVYNYCFISDADKDIFGNGKLIEIENPLSVDQKYLRPSLVPNLLKAVQKNEKNSGKIKIFELGKTFKKEGSDFKEKRMLTLAVLGEEFYGLKGVADALLEKLGIGNVWYDSFKPTPEETKLSMWHSKKCAEVKIDDKEIGFLGEISPRVLGDLKISRTTVLDIDFDLLCKHCSEEHEYRPISKFPAAVRDISILVPKDVLVEEVLNKIEKAGGNTIRDIDLFDIYEGNELPGQKKNLAFHIIYQAEDRTLSSVEIDEIQNKIIKALEKMSEWQVRK
ncbi:MAG: phenylalanine--tRNA ligase subunit beta [Patescibacteria group bacterium]